MTREEKNIKLHTRNFDGMVYAGIGTPNETEIGTFNTEDMYCIRSNSLSKQLLALHKIMYAGVNGFAYPTSFILMATFEERSVIFFDRIDSYFCYKETTREMAIKEMIYQLFERSYGLKPIDVLVRPVGIIIDFGKDGKYYLCEDFAPTHHECITFDKPRSRKVKTLLHAEYIANTKNTKFVGHEILNLKIKEEAQ